MKSTLYLTTAIEVDHATVREGEVIAERWASRVAEALHDGVLNPTPFVIAALERDPAEVEHEKRKDDVLTWINATRQAFGLEALSALRPGERKCSHGCVVAASLEYRSGEPGLKASTVSTSTVLMDDASLSTYTLRHPAHVADFIAAFDRGEYPELEL